MSDEKNVLVIADEEGNIICEVEFDDKTWQAILEAAMRDFVIKAVTERLENVKEEKNEPETPLLIKEADPELERLLAEEEEIERTKKKLDDRANCPWHYPESHFDGYYCDICDMP